MKKTRIKWIDVSKFIGIVLIFFGHMPNIGRYFGVVFKYHIPLFFFLAGCSENFDSEKNFKNYLIKNIKKILIPYFIFAIISIIINFIIYHPTNTIKLKTIYSLLMGSIRNDFIAGSLWFLTCLFIMKLIFYFIKKINNKILIMTICLFIFAISNLLGFTTPRLFYNIDSAFLYMVYYCIGYCGFEIINNLFKCDSKIKKIIFWTVGIVLIINLIMFYIGKDIIFLVPNNRILIIIVNFINILLLIFATIYIAKIFESIELFNSIGKNTLFLCCNEYIIKQLIAITLPIFGLEIKIQSPLQALIYAIILISIIQYYSKYLKLFFENTKKNILILSFKKVNTK